MIAPQRSAHLRIWMALGLALALLFAANLMVRQNSTPVNRNLNWSQFP